MRRRRFLQSLVAGAGLAPLVFAGCAARPEPLRVGANLWPGYAPLRLATAHDGPAAEYGRVLDFPSTSMVLSAFRNGTIDGAALTLDETLLLAANGLEPRIVLVFDFSDGADAIVTAPEIARLESLRGRRIGVETEALGGYLVGRALEQAGLGLHEVNIVTVPLDRHEAAYAAREVDAVVTFEPVRSRLLAAGARELFSSRAIPGEIVDTLVVRKTVLQTRLHDLVALARSHFQSRAELLADPLAAAERLGGRAGMSPAAFGAALNLIQLPDIDANRALLTPGGGGLEPVLRRLQATMLTLEQLGAGPAVEALLAPTVVEALG